ncbi:MAG: ribosome rescue protein RqcH [Candidatus Nanohaloarchaea archaeon]|nr:ribosome rescue protein RqcH [Candidatus Nanohaloarchaea archaeon]
MREELATLDLAALVEEFKEKLEGARINKIYQRGNELTLHVYKPGDKKYRLFLAPGKAFLTSYKRDNPERPPSFCMKLRKHLSGRKINRIEQHDFDRVLKIETEDKVFSAELFGQGNFILAEKDSKKILAVMDSQEWKDRNLWPGEKYKLPEPGIDTPGIEPEEFKNLLEEGEIVKILASDLKLGSVYAEEALHRAGIEKTTEAGDLEESEAEELLKAIQGIIYAVKEKEASEPVIYSEDGRMELFSPIDLETFQDLEKEGFETFSEALDKYFTEKEKQNYKERKEKAYREKKEKLERMKEQQEQKLEGMERAIEEKKEVGDLIYRNYQDIERVLERLEEAKEEHSNEKVRELIKEGKEKGVRGADRIKNLDFANNQAVVEVEGENVKLDLGLSVEKNAEIYYKESKKAKKKLKGAKKALKETEKKLGQLEKEDIDVSKAFKDKEAKRKKKRWYEKFRWFYSQDGFLVVGGKDQTTNEILVKRHMEKSDIYVHADFQGAPSVVIKNPEDKDLPESTLKEAAKLAVTYAKSWQLNVSADDAYWVEPDQVTKEPESGEYLPKGAFVIRGDRNYMRNVEVSAAVGAYERDGRLLPMGGPISAVKAQCKHFVEVGFGNTKKSDLAKKIQIHLHESTGADFDLDRIMRALPPGKGDIKRRE